MRRSRHLKLPSLSRKTCGRRRRELALIFALIFGAAIAGAPLTAREVPFAAQQVISTLADGARSVFAADVDGDGDLDVLSASADDKVAWYENTDGAGTFGSQQVITTLADLASSVSAADVDGDGDLDVFSAAFFGNEIAWDENRGGQFALLTASLAHGILDNSQEEVLFQIDLEHRGRAGDSDLELATIDLRFENGLGSALVTAQADALIETVEIFLDTGSGSFERGADTMIQQISALSLTAGTETIAIPSGANARVAFDSIERYFVVITTTNDADLQAPGTFEVIHLTEASSTGQDASTPTVPLTLEHQTNTTTGVLGTDLTTATCHAPFELDLESFTVATTVVCEAGTVLTAGNGLQVISPGDLTLRAGDLVVLGVDFSVGSGGKLKAEIDPALKP